MDKQELEKYRSALLALEGSLRSKVASAADDALRPAGADESGSLSKVPVHLADLSNDTYQHEVALSLLENEGLLHRQIVAALERIEQGTFGRCVVCGKEIAGERLDILPYTPYCVQDATRLEPPAPGPAGT